MRMRSISSNTTSPRSPSWSAGDIEDAAITRTKAVNVRNLFMSECILFPGSWVRAHDWSLVWTSNTFLDGISHCTTFPAFPYVIAVAVSGSQAEDPGSVLFTPFDDIRGSLRQHPYCLLMDHRRLYPYSVVSSLVGLSRLHRITCDPLETCEDALAC